MLFMPIFEIGITLLRLTPITINTIATICYNTPGNKITAIIFDWAGTIIDQGSCGPMHAFIDIFAAKSIKITGEQVRGPMGMNKIAHIKKLTELPEIQHQWVKKHGQPPLGIDIQELFGLFETALERNLLHHSKLIPDAAKTIEGCREREI